MSRPWFLGQTKTEVQMYCCLQGVVQPGAGPSLRQTPSAPSSSPSNSWRGPQRLWMSSYIFPFPSATPLTPPHNLSLQHGCPLVLYSSEHPLKLLIAFFFVSDPSLFKLTVLNQDPGDRWHIPVSGNIFYCPDWGWCHQYLRVEARILLSTLPCTEQTLQHSMTYLPQMSILPVEKARIVRTRTSFTLEITLAVSPYHTKYTADSESVTWKIDMQINMVKTTTGRTVRLHLSPKMSSA